jgi:hypothetical protein
MRGARPRETTMRLFGISYYDGRVRQGLLLYREPVEGECGYTALGGFDTPRMIPTDPTTVLHYDDRDEVMPGWLHPDRVFALLLERLPM